jgi:drug/metabolite transporter (DMT)-like permease
MSAPPWLWVVFTLLAATAQTFRNATQRSLTDRLGTVGATHIRFLFGLPFGLVFLLVVAAVTGDLVAPTIGALAWTVVGALTQIGATALMLAAMRERSFVVTIAYTKTEPVQVALFAVVFLGEHISALATTAVLVATAGVLVLSWPSRAAREAFSWRPALLGVASAALFALAAVGFRGGILALGTPDYVAAATETLAVSLTVQTILLSAWLMLRRPDEIRAVLAAWRPSLPAGFLGAFASQMWFLAFALQAAAPVRTLGLVEILIAGMVSRRLFAQAPGPRDVIGMALVVAGVALLFNG